MAPTPVRQLLILLYAKIVEPFSYASCFPWVNQMTEFLLPDVDKASIGSYSGCIEGLFALAQFLTNQQWGAVSDKPSVGRKPVILAGLLGLSFAMLLFGSARTFWFAVFARCLCGVLCGNSSVLRAVLGEMVEKGSEGRIYPLFSISFELSIIVAPIVGGLLVDPARQYPHSIFAKIDFFRDLPFFLPCAAVAALALSAFFVVLFFFDETSKAKLAQQSKTPSERQALLEAQKAASESAVLRLYSHSVWEMLAMPRVQKVLLVTFLAVMVSLSFDSVFILFCYSAPENGGLGLNSLSIAQSLSFRGVISIIWAIFIFSPVHQRFGSKRLFRFFVSTWIICFLHPPIMRAIVATNMEKYVVDGRMQPALWPFMMSSMTCYAMGDAMFPLLMIATNDAAPSERVLGSLNGVAIAVGSLGRAIGPICANWVYALSAEAKRPNAVWIGCLGFCIVTSLQSFRVYFASDEEEEDAERAKLLGDAAIGN